MKFQIETQKTEQMVEALEKLQDGLIKNGGGQVSALWTQPKDNEFLLEINYMMENRVTNWIVEREIKKTLKKLDGEIKIKKLKA